MLRSDPIVAPISSIQPLAGAPLPEENGSGTGTAAVGQSGDQRINGVLSGTRWSGGFITYSDPDSASDYQAGHPEPFTNLSQLSANQLQAVHAVLNASVYTQLAGGIGNSVEGFTNLGVDYAGAGSGAGTIRLVNTSDPGTAYAYYPSTGVWGGDVFFGPSGDFPTTGNYDHYTVIHELGHSLGLKHGHESDVYGALPFATDSMEYSVMTYKSYVGSDAQAVYNETWGYARTFMMYDIAALQYMYGADFSTNSGNTVYSWNPNTGDSLVNGALALDPGANRIFETIWDGGGADTYNCSNYTTNLRIDLTPGNHSTLSSAQLAYLGGGPNGGFARGNVFNALQYQGDARSLIENATGGTGSDQIFGNDANNILIGGLGNDDLRGGIGNDYLDAGQGVDQCRGGFGVDTIIGGFQADLLFGGQAGDIFQFNNLQASLPATRDQIRATTGVGPAPAFEGAGVAGVGDLINVVGIDADTTAGGNQAFIFGGGTGKGHLWCTNSGNDTFVNGNVNNNLNVDFRIEIEDAGVSASMYKDFDFML